MQQRIHPNDFQKKKKSRGEGLLAIEKLMRDWENYQGDNDAWVGIGVLACHHYLTNYTVSIKRHVKHLL